MPTLRHAAPSAAARRKLRSTASTKCDECAATAAARGAAAASCCSAHALVSISRLSSAAGRARSHRVSTSVCCPPSGASEKAQRRPHTWLGLGSGLESGLGEALGLGLEPGSAARARARAAAVVRARVRAAAAPHLVREELDVLRPHVAALRAEGLALATHQRLPQVIALAA